MQYTKILCLFFCLFVKIGFAQHSPTLCQGTLPADFYEYSTDKYKKEISAMDKDIRGEEKRNQKDFFLESNFLIDDLLQSGYVLFNDPFSDYLNEVAKVILKDDLSLLSDLRFYAVRSSSVNAFAINQGVIFVNIGLLSQLENEAQLAFVLSHEIAHYVKKHGLEFYLEKKEIETSSNKELLERTNYDDKILAINNFSQEQEMEADSLGLSFFMKTGYDIEAVQGVFDVLQFADLPFDEVAFNKSFFEDEYLVFSKKLHLETIKAINTTASEEDTHSTHPSIPKRRQLAEKMYAKATPNNQKILVAATKFDDIQKRARVELLGFNLRDNDYYAAIYNAFLLLKDEPDNFYYQKTVGKALYALSAISNANELKDLLSDHQEIEGEIGRLHYFINNIGQSELAILAFRYNYLLSQKHPADAELQTMLVAAAGDLLKKYPDQLLEMKAGKPVEKTVEQEAPFAEESKSELSKIEKIKAQVVQETNNLTYAFGDFLNEESYQQLMEKGKKASRVEDKSTVEEDRFWDRTFTSRRTTTKNIHALGQKKVLVLSPFYKKFNYNFKKENYIKSEKAQTYFHEIIQKNANIAGLDLVILDANNLNKNQVTEFNEIRHLNEWIGQQFAYKDEVNHLAFNQPEVSAIAEKYGAEAILLTGIVTGKVPKGSELWAMFLYSPPAFLYSVFTPKGETAVFSVVLDLKTGRILMDTFDIVGDTDNKDILNQRVYEIVWQISRTRKRK